MPAREEQTGTLQDRVEAVLGPLYAGLRLLDVGGSASVFIGTNRQLARIEALKVVSWEQVDEAHGLERFRREWKALAGLRHEHIITIYAANLDEKQRIAYLAQEYLEGGSLARRLEAGALPIEVGLPTAVALADALAHAHAHDILHRDIKPDNILYDARDRVVLSDFGIAHRIGAERLTHAQMNVGTPSYMSPEQLRQEEPTPASDLFSLGLVFYEMFTGQRLFRGHDVATVLEQHRRRGRRHPRAIRPELPAALCDLIMALLAHDPAQRPASALDVAGRLHALRKPLDTQGTREGVGDNGAGDARFEAGLETERNTQAARNAGAERTGNVLRLLTARSFRTRQRSWILATAAVALAIPAGLVLSNSLSNGRPRDHGGRAKSVQESIQGQGQEPAQEPAQESTQTSVHESPPDPGPVRKSTLRQPVVPEPALIECPLRIELSHTGLRDLIEEAHFLTIHINGTPHGPTDNRYFLIQGMAGDSIRVHLEQPGLSFYPRERIVVIPDDPQPMTVEFRVDPGTGGY